MKSVVTAYLWWVVGGWLGAHHFYLGRDRHAFVWWCTAGGVCGLGWLRDAWRIPEYVAEANGDARHEVTLTRRLRYARPAFNPTRFAGQLLVGSLFGFATRLALPEELVWAAGWTWLPYVLVPYAVALGVHTVGNIGREHGPITSALVGSFLALPLYGYSEDSCISYSSVASAISFNWVGKQFRPHPPSHHASSLCSRVAVLFLSGLLYSSLWASFVYHNAKIHLEDGEEIRIKHAIDNFLQSPQWIKVKESAHRLMVFGYEHGWERLFEEIVLSVFDEVDPGKTEWAQTVLNSTLLQSGSTDGASVAKRCRELLAKHHPDRHQDQADKDEAARKFMDIQSTCQHLTRGRWRGRRRGS